MKVKTHLMAFEDDKIREVEIDDKWMCCSSCMNVLDEIFRLGQNDFQPQQIPSLSVGDMIEWECGNHKYWLIMPVAFKAISEDEFEQYKKIPRRDRVLAVYKMK